MYFRDSDDGKSATEEEEYHSDTPLFPTDDSPVTSDDVIDDCGMKSMKSTGHRAPPLVPYPSSADNMDNDDNGDDHA